MRLGGLSLAFGLWLAACGQAAAQAPSASARIETTSLRLVDPDPYQVTAVLAPIRRVKIVAPMDGMIRSVEARLGASVRERDELVHFESKEADARLRIATAEVKQIKATGVASNADKARLEAAEARVDLARAALDRCILHAPFTGRITGVAVYPGQFVLRGTPLVELADTSSLTAVLPVDRRVVAVGSTINVPVEEQEHQGKVLAILPLPEHYAVLRELATPFAAATVAMPNPKGQLDAGLRARPVGVPLTPIANVPKRSLRADDLRGASSSMVQVIRNEYVANVPVQVLGGLGPDRVQVSGLFRPGDALIIGSSVPMVPGTLVRFQEGAAPRGIEATSPNPAHGGLDAGIVPPGGYAPTNRRTGTGSTRQPPAQSQAGNSTPF